MMKQLKSIFKYILFFVLVVLFALSIRLFVFNLYVVPGDSMEPALLPGDFIFTDKYTYGARVLTSLNFDENSDPPMKHVPGFRDVRRNDVIVFNFPYRNTWDTIRMSLSTILVKRCIGLPGESISAIGGFYHVAGITDTLGYVPEQKRQLSSRSTLDSVLVRAFAFDESFHWDIFDFGPFYIPAKGSNIRLTPANFKLYHKMIAYETNAAVRMEDSLVYINDSPRHDYTFLNNWYFVAGDKVINSQDSRYIGLIPEAFIIGRASMVITSKDNNTGKRRWNRTFARIR